MTRRDWMASSTAAVLAACTSADESADQTSDEPNIEERIIDAHVHIWTSDTEKYPLHSNYKKEDMDPATFTAEELFGHCRASGVNRINLIQMSFYYTDHSYMLDMMEEHPDNFVGTGVLPDVLDEKSQVPAEMMVELSAKRCYAFLMNPGDMPEVGRMCGKHPDTPVIIDHLARIGANEPVKDEQVDELCRLAKHKNIQVKVGAFYALGDAKPPYTDLLPMIERVVDAYGPDRCMWESDCPYQVQDPHTYDDSVALIRDHADFLSASDKEKILVTTAETFFFKR